MLLVLALCSCVPELRGRESTDAGVDSGVASAGGEIIQLTAATSHSCALLSNGRMRCWGLGMFGQLGYGNKDNVGVDEPVSEAGYVQVGDGPVKQIAANGSHTCVLFSNGKVRCWGLGAYGQLGYGNEDTVGDHEHPSSLGYVDIGGDVAQITTGVYHTCALLVNGKVRCWGNAEKGRLGYGNTNHVGDTEPPSSAGDVDVGGDVIQIAAGEDYTCALLVNGRVRCWGNAENGRLGYGNTENIGDTEHPSDAGDVPLGEDVGGVAGHGVVQIAAGRHTCALLSSGGVRCWGPNKGGQLGYGNVDSVGDNETPTRDVPLLDNASAGVVQIAASATHSCAVLSNAKVMCWGWNGDGQLGYGNTKNVGDDELPSSAGVVDVGGDVIEIATGGLHTCALLGTRRARCWGNGENGRLGYGMGEDDVGNDELPSSVGDVPLQ